MSGKCRGRIWLGPLLVLLSVTSVNAAAGEAPLVTAVKAGDARTVRALLLRRVDVNLPGADGSTALHWAANRGDLDTIDLLLRAGANAKVANRYGVTPILLACKNGSASVIERLLKAGADANAPGAGGETPLMIAARTGRADAIRVLAANGANVNARESTRGQSALMWAAAEGNVEAITALIEAGAEVNARSEEHDFKKISGGMSSGKKQEVIQFTPLMFAVRDGHVEAVEALLDAGVAVNEPLSDGTSALILAVINAHFELAGILLDRGANPNDDRAGGTALHQVARTRSLTVGHVPHPVATGKLSSFDLAKKLIASGANVNARMTKDSMRTDGYRTQLNRIGATPYLLAAKGVDHELMRLLLASGADPLLTNDHGMRPLMVAAGVAMHAPGEDSGTDADALEAVKVAFEVDGNVNYIDKRGQTALHGAARRGAIEIVKFLLDKGAKLDVKVKRENFVGNTYGDKGFEWTPLTIALGRQKDGRHLFLGSARQPEAALILYQEMKQRGLPIDEDPQSLAELDAMMAKAEQARAK